MVEKPSPMPDALWKDIQKHLPALMGMARKLATSQANAEDLVQDTLVRVIVAHKRFELGTNLMGWMATILRNVHFSQHRKRKREVEDPEGIYAANLSVKPAQLDHLELQECLAAMESIPVVQQQALADIVMGESYEYAAKHSDVAVGTIKSRVSRARMSVAGNLAQGSPETEGHSPLVPTPKVEESPQKPAPKPTKTYTYKGEKPMTYTNGHTAHLISSCPSWVRFFPAKTQGRIKERDIEMAKSVINGRISDDHAAAVSLLRDVTDALITTLQQSQMKKPEQRQTMISYLEQNVYVDIANGQVCKAVEKLCIGFFDTVPGSQITNARKGTRLINNTAIKRIFDANTTPGASGRFLVAMSEMMKERIVFGRNAVADEAPEQPSEAIPAAETTTALTAPEAAPQPAPDVIDLTLAPEAAPVAEERMAAVQETAPAAEAAKPVAALETKASVQTAEAEPDVDEDELAAERFELFISTCVREGYGTDEILRLVGCENLEDAMQMTGFIDEVRDGIEAEKEQSRA